ncbi:MAG: DNA polymerase III subunit alpha [Dehalococcoidia bacterium]|nr:DNA polymerase III subunit alpha [Dehalococcoidia bacterium]
MTSPYTELHLKSFYSFGVGASHTHELLAQAKDFGYGSLALTDTNLCGALEFARLSSSLGLRPITGGELTLKDESRVVLLAKSRRGYANLSRLFTLANAVDRREPRLDPVHLSNHTEGLVLLSGGRDGPTSKLLLDGRRGEAGALLKDYLEWFGAGSVYVELQRNFLQGDAELTRASVGLAMDLSVPIVASNDVHYHHPERYRLQNALVAARFNTTMEQALPHIRPNNQLSLKSPTRMCKLFEDIPEAIANTLKIAQACQFNLATDLGYTLPEPAVPASYTAESYLRRLCSEAALRRYGTVTPEVDARLDEEFHLISRHQLAGFLLLYREIVLLAQKIMEEKGLSHPETPLEERPPGRGRGSSVALLVGYLIGISHVDPLRWGLTLERFIPEDMTTLPDIDLDFPRALRDELIERVHRHFGPEFAVLAGAVSTYSVKGIIQDLGKALGLPKEDLRMLSRQLHTHDAHDLKTEMLELPAFRAKVEAPGWRDLLSLAPQLMHAPRSLGQHVGGMVLSDSPIPEMVPIREGAIEGRYIMDWNKDSTADAGFAKIDLLSLSVLDQIEEALDLVEHKEGRRPDISAIDPDDPAVYEMLGQGRSKGVFLLQSPAQLKMGQRLRPRNLLDLAYQVALIRPGVGVQGSAVSKFVDRYRHGAQWDYDHPLERRALERGCGIIVWQEQVVQLISDVSGMSTSEADEIRRAFARPNSDHLIAMHRRRFLEGALANGVPQDIGKNIFNKINGHYMFPESHSHAFAVTAYQAAWLKCHHPLEFFVALMNSQPMGFYPVETIKEDARRFGVPFVNPCVNLSGVTCSSHNGSVLLGLGKVKDVGEESAKLIVEERDRHGFYTGAGALVRRTGLRPQTVHSLVMAGAFDAVTANRREVLWDAGLPVRPPRNGQRALPISTGDNTPELEDFTAHERMAGEYAVMGIYPKGHMMEFVRPTLPSDVLSASAIDSLPEGEQVLVAGWPVARQHPRGMEGTVFVTIEDETGDVQLIVWPRVFARYKRELGNHVLLAEGVVSRHDGTTNVMMTRVKTLDVGTRMPDAHDWH